MEPWGLTLGLLEAGNGALEAHSGTKEVVHGAIETPGKTPGLHLEPPQWPKNETLWYQCMSHVHIQGKVLYWFTYRKSALPYLI